MILAIVLIVLICALLVACFSTYICASIGGDVLPHSLVTTMLGGWLVSAACVAILLWMKYA